MLAGFALLLAIVLVYARVLLRGLHCAFNSVSCVSLFVRWFDCCVLLGCGLIALPGWFRFCCILLCVALLVWYVRRGLL